MSDRARRVAVVTGGAIGIGAAIAEELGRAGADVVTMDPVVTLDGSPQDTGNEPTTADRIVAAGGAARASSTSVTDEPAVRALFEELVDEFGGVDVVVNVAGISRATGFGSGTEDDWIKVLDVHLNGYLTVLRVALPVMVAAGRGIVLGVTSGSGWRAADAGAYSCAKRAVASLTWQVGQATPDGVSVNALSPIAATRMVTNALSRLPASADQSGRSAASGGVALGAAPPPEHLGPIGAYLASEELAAWCRGRILFSNGSEVSVVAPPHLIEVVRTDAVPSPPAVVAAAVSTALAGTEAAQVSNGGSVPRLTAAYAPDSAVAPSTGSGRCVVVTDDAEWRTAFTETLAANGFECVDGDASATGLAGTAAALAAAAGSGDVDAVIVARVGAAATGRDVAPSSEPWQHVLDTHAGITDAIFGDAAWARAVADRAAATERPIRLVTITNATTPGGKSRALAAAQLARAGQSATEGRVDAFAIAVEADDADARDTTALLVAHLVGADDAAPLAGAELVVDREWFGLRSHPNVYGTVTYGGPDVPDWIDAALRRIAIGEHASG